MHMGAWGDQESGGRGGDRRYAGCGVLHHPAAMFALRLALEAFDALGLHAETGPGLGACVHSAGTAPPRDHPANPPPTEKPRGGLPPQLTVGRRPLGGGGGGIGGGVQGGAKGGGSRRGLGGGRSGRGG